MPKSKQFYGHLESYLETKYKVRFDFGIVPAAYGEEGSCFLDEISLITDRGDYILFRFLHYEEKGTYGFMQVFLSQSKANRLGAFGFNVQTKTKLHPDDEYDRCVGVRLVSKRLIIEEGNDLLLYMFGISPKDLYRAVRILVPEKDPDKAGGPLPSGASYLVGEEDKS